LTQSILIVGVGNMGAALARGLAAAPAEDFAYRVRVHDLHVDRAQELGQKCGVEVVVDLAKEALPDRCIVLCVKPQDLAAVTDQLTGRMAPDCLVITILAGVTIADLTSKLGGAARVVRAMPNIAATVHAAATAMCASDAVTPADRTLAERIFGAIGVCDWTKEGLLDAVTGLSGSGPAYVYMVIEALTDGGVKMGIPRVLAAKLATQTVLGSALLVKVTGTHPAILREQVTTPGGTTINAIHELEDRGLRAMLISAVQTATERAAALRKK
jgi:pyrroline-5-carboxylate reductase